METNGDIFRCNLHVIAPVSNTHDGLNNFHAVAQLFKKFRFVCCAPNVCVGGVRLFSRCFVRKLARCKELAHLRTATHFINEGGVKPWLVNAKRWIHHEAIAIETFDVVALVGAAIAPDINAVFLHGAHEQCSGNGTA